MNNLLVKEHQLTTAGTAKQQAAAIANAKDLEISNKKIIASQKYNASLGNSVYLIMQNMMAFGQMQRVFGQLGEALTKPINEAIGATIKWQDEVHAVARTLQVKMDF